VQHRKTAGALPVLALLSAVLVLSGCGSSKDSSSGGSGTQVALHIHNYAFDPAQLQLKAGQTVTFVVDNADAVEHNLTIDGLKVNKDVSASKTAKATTKLAPGTYTFHCEYHPKQMTGTVTVA